MNPRPGLAALLALVFVTASTTRADAPATQPAAKPPAGAIVLFDGTNLDKWQHRDGSPLKWVLTGDGAAEVKGGDAVTKDTFGDFTLHLEFWLPKAPDDVKGQGRGNSGVYLLGVYEIQILDSWGVEKLKPGDVGGIYQQKPADVNASTPPETWQTYDITFRAPRFDGAGNRTEKARVSVVHNGQPIHTDVELNGTTPSGISDKESATGPILLQDHGNPVRYRNIWIDPTTETNH
jgi:hypothetical protein